MPDDTTVATTETDQSSNPLATDMNSESDIALRARSLLSQFDLEVVSKDR